MAQEDGSDGRGTAYELGTPRVLWPETGERGSVKEGFMSWALETLGSHSSSLTEHRHHAPPALVSRLPLQ